MTVLKPWAYGPFELIVHAELHYLDGEDFDRRVAMIGFDNAIEVAITTYLGLNPIQRGNRQYPRADVDRWLTNYHSKIDFFVDECAQRDITLIHGKDEIVWFHDVRNGQYHGGGAAVPQTRELEGVRTAALQVFSVLFDQNDAETLVAERIAELNPHVRPERSDSKDRAIDGRFGTTMLAGQELYTSELLYAWDAFAYSDLASELGANDVNEDDTEEAE